MLGQFKKQIIQATEMLYDDTCTITEYQKIKNEITKRTESKEVDIIGNQSCKISFKSSPSTKLNQGAESVTQIIKLLISPEITVKPGSKITVTHNGVSTAYQSSGVPAVYSSHQEIILKLFKGWA